MSPLSPFRLMAVGALAFAWAIGAPEPVAHAGARDAPSATPTIELGGDRQHAYTFAPVYRRLDRLAVRIDGIAVPAGQEVRVTLERVPPTGQPRKKALIGEGPLRELTVTDAAGRTPAHVAAKLGEPGRLLPVGRYRVNVRYQREAGYESVAVKPLFVIFNAAHPADRDVHKPDPEHWLRPTLNIVQLVGGQLTADPWTLDVHDPEVFELAMSLADGTRTGLEAAEQLVVGACAEVEGHWPNLPDTDGQIPPNTPGSDPDWQAGEVTSATRRLTMVDARGQCFDYAMIYVALLRSIGVPARTVTSIDPAPMPHPHDTSRKVQWDYHVWAEVHLGQQWWASDVTYLDEPLHSRLPPDKHPGLQMPHDMWFARSVGPDTRLWAVEHGVLRDVSGRYGGLTNNKARQLVRARDLE